MKPFHRHFHAEALLILTALFSLLLVTELVAPAAATPVTWNLTGVSFVDGGGATGWFTYDASSSMKITDWNITAAFGNPPPPPLSVQNLASLTPAALASNGFAALNSTYIAFSQFDPSGLPYYALSIQTALSLDGASGPLTIVTDPAASGPGGSGGGSSSSYNVIWSSDGPYFGTNVIAGQLTTTVLEPSSLLLLGSGLVGLCVWGRKKFKSI